MRPGGGRPRGKGGGRAGEGAEGPRQSRSLERSGAAPGAGLGWAGREAGGRAWATAPFRAAPEAGPGPTDNDARRRLSARRGLHRRHASSPSPPPPGTCRRSQGRGAAASGRRRRCLRGCAGPRREEGKGRGWGRTRGRCSPLPGGAEGMRGAPRCGAGRALPFCFRVQREESDGGGRARLQTRPQNK